MRWMTAKRTIFLALCVLVVFGGACEKKKKVGAGGEDGAGALGEEGLGSSLGAEKAGRNLPEDGLLKDIHFGYDSADIDAGERDRLAQNVEWLRQNPRAKIELEGHCDSRGTIEYNLGLGAKRAKAVKDALVGAGIAADRLSTISYGKELPLCPEESESCWARNRRVHGVLLGK